jgi:hypothetical protein
MSSAPGALLHCSTLLEQSPLCSSPLCWSKVNFEENFQQHPVFRAPAQDQELFCFHTLCRCLSICSRASCGLCVFACVCVPVCRWGSFKQLALSANVDAPCPTDSAHLYISVVVPVCAKTTQPSCFMNCRVLKQSKRKYAAYTHTNNESRMCEGVQGGRKRDVYNRSCQGCYAKSHVRAIHRVCCR